MKVAPLAAATLLHAAAIASFAIPVLDTTPPDAPMKAFTVALLPGQDAKTDSPEAGEPPASAKFVPASRQVFRQPAVGTNPAEPVRAVENSTAIASGAGASVAAVAGQSRTAASIPAHYAAGNRKPDYPLLARRLEEEGTVLLRVLVREDGTAGQVIVRQSSGHELLDESARSAVEKWRFQPASVGNVAVAEWYQVAIPFTLYN